MRTRTGTLEAGTWAESECADCGTLCSMSALNSLSAAFASGGWPMWLIAAVFFLGAVPAAVIEAKGRRWVVSYRAATVVLWASAAFGTILGLIHSFAGVAGVDPSMKATLLAKGISEAMNCMWLAGVTGFAAWVVRALARMILGRP